MFYSYPCAREAIDEGADRVRGMGDEGAGGGVRARGRENRGLEEGEGRKIERDGKRGIFCALRSEKGGGRQGVGRGREAYPLFGPSYMSEWYIC